MREQGRGTELARALLSAHSAVLSASYLADNQPSDVCPPSSCVPCVAFFACGLERLVEEVVAGFGGGK
jgi:hypothetical protein